MSSLEKFVKTFLEEYEKKKKIISFLVSTYNSDNSVLDSKDFCKAILVFSSKLSDVELDLMEAEGIDVATFYEILSLAEDRLGVAPELTEEDLKDFENIDLGEIEYDEDTG